MRRVRRTSVKAFGVLVALVLLFCLVLISERAIGEKPPQKSTDAIETVPKCPDSTLSSIDELHPEKIKTIASGFVGLPCTASIATKAPDHTPDAQNIAVRLQLGFDYYSWLTFIALNSPSDLKSSIGSDTRTAWETWKQLPDVMLPGGAKPLPWNSSDNGPQTMPACPLVKPKGKLVIHMDVEETYNEPFKSGVLFDQNGNYALFVIYMNQAMFEYIAGDTGHSLYSIKGQESFKGNIDFPSGSEEGGLQDVGAVMIKASWKILKPGDDAINRTYHNADAILYRPNAPEKCQEVKLGMTGFHVGHKTKDRQQWVWTTFEHNDNVPTQAEVAAGIANGKTYSFYSPSCDASTCPINQTPPWPWDPDKLDPPWVPFEHPSKFKSQIIRTGPVTPTANSPTSAFQMDRFNKAFHEWPGIKGTAWENYDLITTQWPSDKCSTNPSPGSLPDPTCGPFPTFLANTTLETFSQQERNAGAGIGVPIATSSCISCHNNATTRRRFAGSSEMMRSDFTYILEKAEAFGKTKPQ